MRTYKRICVKDATFREPQVIGDDRVLTLERGKEYITSEEKDGEVHVFSRYWAWVPANLFAGEELFTKG